MGLLLHAVHHKAGRSPGRNLQAGRASEELKQNLRLDQKSRLAYDTDFSSVRRSSYKPLCTAIMHMILCTDSRAYLMMIIERTKRLPASFAGMRVCGCQPVFR